MKGGRVSMGAGGGSWYLVMSSQMRKLCYLSIVCVWYNFVVNND